MSLASEQRRLDRRREAPGRTTPVEPAHELFELFAFRAPEAVAVEFRGQTLSYGQLNQRANQLARELLTRGIGLGCRVVVCVEPDFDVAVALLAILKAGAVYVPLDPSYPPGRVHAILEETGPAVILTQRRVLSHLEFAGTPTLLLDALPSGSTETLENPALSSDPQQAAYVFFTSGTTGTPKGVLGSQANLYHYIASARRHYGIGASDVMPALARFSFSISLFELMLPLVSGAKLLILEREHVLDPARLAATLGEVTIVHAGPSLWKSVVARLRRRAESAAFSRLRHVSSGGDMVPPELLAALQEIFVHAEVFVIYGSSEISCMGCTYLVPRDRPVTTTYVGRPFDNVVMRVLDAANQVTPAGVSGEIHFAGDGVTLGYLNRPELTRESFVMLEGRRFYRTGDRGRLNQEGLLEVLGRGDSQVKIRGMRVELAEVEQHLRRAPGVRDAVAAARPGVDGEKLLVAYLVSEPTLGAKAARLAGVRGYLLTHLPDYMLPAVYVELESLPVNHNLKVDRRALPEPSEADFRAFSVSELRTPETASERVLAALFRELLGVALVGLDDNFFELGGHSLLAQRFCAAVKDRLGIELEAIALLREPLGVLASLCDQKLGTPSRAPQRAARATLTGERIELFHFGPGGTLCGALHGNVAGASEAALLCPPVGQEHVRSGFVLKQLAKSLAAAGVPTLSFDYFGCGDSLGRSEEADSRRWQRDIESAHAELLLRCAGARITAVGVRLGALLLCDAAQTLELSKLVLWDPVCDGKEHLGELRALQRAYLRSVAPLRFFSARSVQPGPHELLGTSYSEAVVHELGSLALAALLARRPVPTRWLSTSQSDHEDGVLRGLGVPGACRVECVDIDCGWHDLAELEDVIPDVRLSSTLTALVIGDL